MRKALIALGIAANLLLADTTHPVFNFTRKNCLGCHTGEKAAGEVDLSAFKDPKAFDEERSLWERIATKIRRGEMPPAPIPQPPAKDRNAVLHALDAEFHRQDKLAIPDPGRVTARRLNKTEYNNTLRDLLGVDIQPAESFPNDEAAYGFDNIADALTMPPVLVEKYLYAAERALRTAIYGPEKLKPAALHFPSPVRIPVLPKDLFNYDKTGLSTHHATHVLHRFAVDGEYSFRLVLNGHRPQGSDPVTPALFIDGKLIQSWTEDGEDLEGRIVEARTQVKAGEHLVSASYLNVYEGLPPKYGGPKPSTPQDLPTLSSPTGKLTERDIELLRKYGTKLKTDRAEVRVDNRYESIDIGGPFTQSSAPTRKLIYTCTQQTTPCATAIIGNFTRRAFRRPVTTAETTKYLNLFQLARKQGDSFDEGILTALQGVLVAPNFLYRIEENRQPLKGKNYASITDHELATRLSYFLWSSMPDEPLFRAASSGTLRQPAVFKAQISRMLKDAKSRALVENFAGQWLQFKNIDVMKPDVDKFPDFDEGLRYAMRQETSLFLENLIRQDGSVLEVLNAKHTYLNERLARFYGIPGVTGHEFRRVDMTNSKRGGGVLAHASVLTTTSYSTRTSPVVRGKWILENLVHAPPPAPPPSVPPLEEAKGDSAVSLRQQMEAHRKNPACASCHARMDPLGFGLENFDGIGKWRDLDGKAKIDPSGEMPGNHKFAGPEELKQLLLQDRHDYLKGLTEKLLIYALGRGLERHDKPVVNTIAAKDKYKFSELIEEIANSLPFQMRRTGESL
ncbi:MAG: DUF1592 domain-containing protein [Acidobacteria bacterium]|nr:DUF1592 domain-containing protein [Acidobacteriota bacterium]